MGERKVLNKYYPPDFDPAKLAQKTRQLKKATGDRSKKQHGPKQMTVRYMMPFTMCCSTCHEFCYVGTKFNSRVERVAGEDYLGIAVWRFYGKCPSCCCEFAFKTDPQNCAYILEYGGTRTYDPHRDASLVAEDLKDRIKREMEGDVMKTLEHKTYTTANELLDLEQLDELRRMNKRLLNQTDLTNEALMKVINNGSGDSPNAAGNGEDQEVRDFLKEKQSLRIRQHNPTAAAKSDKSRAETANENDERAKCRADGMEAPRSSDSDSSDSESNFLRPAKRPCVEAGLSGASDLGSSSRTADAAKPTDELTAACGAASRSSAGSKPSNTRLGASMLPKFSVKKRQTTSSSLLPHYA